MRRALIALFVGAAALAGPAARGQAPDASAAPADPERPFRLSLGYEGRLVVKVLDLQVEQEAGAKSYDARAHMTTSGILALFKKLRLDASASGRLADGAPSPGVFTYQNLDGKKNRRVSAQWTPQDVLATASPPFPNLGDPPPSRAQRLQGSDPLTQLMRITLAPGSEPPCSGSAHFFDGRQRYDLDLSYRGAAEPSDRERRLGLMAPIRCAAVYREIAGFKRKPIDTRNRALKDTVTLGLARAGADGPWVVSFLSADTFMGPAHIDLTRMTLTGARPS